MNDDYGCKVAMAFAAIHQVYLDASKLLQDCDAAIGKDRPLATKSMNAILGVSYSLGRQWMPWGAFRCYEADSACGPGTVDAVSVWFYDLDNRIQEPFLVVGRVYFGLQDGQKVQDICRGYELVFAFAGAHDRQANVVLKAGPMDPSPYCGRVERSRMIGVPLFSIGSIQDVEALMDRVRTTEESGSGESAKTVT